MKKITVKPGAETDDYKAYGSLYTLVNQFEEDVREFPEKLEGKTIWMINSTAIGGGVAEMLPSQMRIIRALGINIEWLVIEATDNAFFNLTKQIHNAIHGSGKPNFTQEDRDVYERVNSRNLEKALEYIQDGDVVVIHDPQPMPLGRMIREHKKVDLVWRCHIGLETENETTKAVWDFLSPYFDDYDHFVFSLPSYVPEVLRDRAAIIPPAIDPLSHKNRMLWMSKCLGILQQSGIIRERPPMLNPNYKHQVRRVMPDGSFDSVNHDSELDIIFHPTILQISRWDRLKGFKELMEAFILMKRENEKKTDKSSLAYRRIRHCRLALGGPDPAFVSDDPEGMEVLDELIEQYKGLSVDLQRAIALLLLPLDNPKENALIVNALQRSATIVVQNSIQEGFGLTATEAMWKQRPVLVSGAAGLRAQVQHDVNGRINPDPADIPALAKCLDEMLSNPLERDKWGFNGQVRVINNFTLFSQIKSWLALLSSLD